MLYEVLEYLGIFKYGKDMNLVKDVLSGTFKIENGSIALPAVKDGVYIAIRGSDLNDGAYAMPTFNLTDEVFSGRVYIIRNIKPFMALVTEIQDWCEKNTTSVYTSESFGGYTYSRMTTSSGNAATWKQVFAERLKPWKKV